MAAGSRMRAASTAARNRARSIPATQVPPKAVEHLSEYGAADADPGDHHVEMLGAL